MVQSTSGGGNDREDGEADYSEIKARLDRLEEKLGDADERNGAAKKGPSAEESAARGRAMGIAFRIATDMVAGVAVGGFLGWVLDRWLGTAPIYSLCFCFWVLRQGCAIR
jgi:ATP synthase protein I